MWTETHFFWCGVGGEETIITLKILRAIVYNFSRPKFVHPLRSDMLLSFDWYVFFLDCSAFEDGAERLSRSGSK